MNRIAYYLLLCLLFLSSFLYRQNDVFKEKEIKANTLSVAFYNLDNLYDTIDDTDHHDDEFTPSGKFKWTGKRYRQKLFNMSEVISKMIDGKMPDVLGVCELESKKALEELMSTGSLKSKYGCVHYDSPDERGIDVALAYNKEKLVILHSEKVPVVLTKDLKDKTRDQLYVKAILKGTRDTLHFYVCHFPSRKEGTAESEVNRIDAAKTCKNFIHSHIGLKTSNLIVMGDFNDEPWDSSISEIIAARDFNKDKTADLLNLMWDFPVQKRGTYRYKDEMYTLDQMMISHALEDGKGLEYKSNTVGIFDADWLKQKGKYQGYPLRTFGGNKWLNGYSDHYAVYMTLAW